MTYMKPYAMKYQLLILLVFTVFTACKKEVTNDSQGSRSSQQSSLAVSESPLKGKWKQFSPKIRSKNTAILKSDEYYKDFFSKMNRAVDPSECSSSPLDPIIEGYLNEFDFWDFVLYPDYASISQLAAIIDNSKQYFGANGEYTHLVVKQQRRLESFWNMPNQIRINGQHTATLDNRDRVAQVFMVFGNATPGDAYYIADQVIAMSKESRVFPETPLLAFDGFATTSKLIVLGDGLITALTATGIADDIVVAGIISHEWGHQLQYANSKKWFGFSADDRPQTAEFTRQMELEADFFSSYFLTHKRGGAYNWKRVAGFNELFFNIGDCSFTSPGHHGTPRQRLNASRLGYSVADQTMPRGHILSADRLHQIFMQNFKSLL